jgi:hypothetical protein
MTDLLLRRIRERRTDDLIRKEAGNSHATAQRRATTRSLPVRPALGAVSGTGHKPATNSPDEIWPDTPLSHNTATRVAPIYAAVTVSGYRGIEFTSGHVIRVTLFVGDRLAGSPATAYLEESGWCLARPGACASGRIGLGAELRILFATCPSSSKR